MFYIIKVFDKIVFIDSVNKGKDVIDEENDKLY